MLLSGEIKTGFPYAEKNPWHRHSERLENSMFQLGKIMVLSMITQFGTASIAANAVSNTIAVFQTLPGMAIGNAVLTVSAQCAGAGDYEQVKYYAKSCTSSFMA
mgnify:FL=1